MGPAPIEAVCVSKGVAASDPEPAADSRITSLMARLNDTLRSLIRRLTSSAVSGSSVTVVRTGTSSRRFE